MLASGSYIAWVYFSVMDTEVLARPCLTFPSKSGTGNPETMGSRGEQVKGVKWEGEKQQPGPRAVESRRLWLE